MGQNGGAAGRRTSNVPVVIKPEGEVAGDGSASGVGDVKTDFERFAGVPPCRDKPGGGGRLVEADEANRHAVAGSLRREEGQRERGGKGQNQKSKCGKVSVRRHHRTMSMKALVLHHVTFILAAVASAAL